MGVFAAAVPEAAREAEPAPEPSPELACPQSTWRVSFAG
jgi:hypothetical protein